MNFQLRKWKARLVVALFVLFLWYFFHWSLGSTEDRVQTEVLETLEPELGRSVRMDGIDIHSSVYNFMGAKLRLGSIIQHYPFSQRCNMYMNQVLTKKLTLLPHSGLKFEREDFAPGGNLHGARKSEQRLHDQLTHLRVFEKCYLSDVNQDEMVQRQRMLMPKAEPYHWDLLSLKYTFFSCNMLEARLFPWLSFKMPVYKLYDGTRYYPEQRANKAKDKKSRGCFLKKLENGLQGRGIVISLADKFLEEAIRLFKILRFLKNDLPIEIVHINELSQGSIEKLTRAARSHYIVGGEVLPAQDVSFVDAAPALNPKYRGKFSTYGSKIAATLFNSFEEMLLIDADAVLLREPKKFFDIKKYKDKGTLFFKDRAAVEYRPANDIIFFKKMLPSIWDTIYFGIPQITTFSLDRHFFKNFNHYIESGLVPLNRRRHFYQPILMAEMFFHRPILDRLWGEKELFWLSLLVLGDEEYAFNENFVAAVGVATPENERPASKYGSKEVCCNHPAHISDEDNYTLLWINSGFRQCGKVDSVDFVKEFLAKLRYLNLKTLEEFREFFRGKIKIKHAVIPPTERILAKNIEGEPSMSWIHMKEYCDGYTWCAYSLIGGKEKEGDTSPSNQISGTFIEFKEQDTKKFDAIGDVWLSHDFL